ncbi:MAG: hypothetical protein GC192_20645 [Bacteroidetes bacterium]|nr:hypothetical protein [Bacteroidota bacterium]
MNSQKNIFSAFKEGSDGLSVQPSAQAWQKLENRLDFSQKRNGSVVLMRWVSAIAAMFLLIAGIYFVNNQTSDTGVAFDHEPSPSYLEDLVNTEGCNPFCLLLNERKELPSYYANPVRK